MATPSNLVIMEKAAVISAQHEGRRHLQRLIRKVKHVLIVKHCIDDLKSGVGLRKCRGVLLQRTYVYSHLLPIHSTLSLVANSIPSFNLFTQFGCSNVHEGHYNGCSAMQLKAY